MIPNASYILKIGQQPVVVSCFECGVLFTGKVKRGHQEHGRYCIRDRMVEGKAFAVIRPDFRIRYERSKQAIRAASKQQVKEEGAAEQRGDDAHGYFRGGEGGARDNIAEREKRATEEECGGIKAAMVRAYE